MHYHMKKHLGEGGFQCKECDKHFLLKTALETHVAARHSKDTTGKRTFPCPFDSCGFVAMSKGNVRTHCMRIHFAKELAPLLERGTGAGADKETIVCTACADTFGSLPAFYYHAIKCIEISHTDPRAAILDTLL